MKSKSIIALMVFSFIFVIGCAGTSEQTQDLSFDPNEPWTGTWEVRTTETAMFTNDFMLKLKQDSNLVNSVRGSDFVFKGKIVGNRLEGIFFDNEVQMRHDIDVKISEDLKSFEGIDLRQRLMTVPIRGVRQD